MGNHVKSRALCYFPSLKKQKLDFLFFFYVQCIIKQLSIRFGFCDFQNNQGLGTGYQPQPSASGDNPYLGLDYSGYHKNVIQ